MEILEISLAGAKPVVQRSRTVVETVLFYKSTEIHVII
tara:strand:- start:985 stop:1098 length:114 start_codon:yes stop_codon:yes gene_type:complete